MTDRYYVGRLDNGETVLARLGGDGGRTYPLPELPPGLTQQLNEWYRWRDAIKQAMGSPLARDDLYAVFCDLLGDALNDQPEKD